MLMAYLPQSKILVNADLYSPPQGGNLANVGENAAVLFRNVERLNLDVAQHVPIHGNPGPEADFERIVARWRPGHQCRVAAAENLASHVRIDLRGVPRARHTSASRSARIIRSCTHEARAAFETRQVVPVSFFLIGT
jgi:hypothetical protein